MLAQFEPVLIGGTEIPKGGRNDGLFRIASAMRGEGMELDEIAGELLQKNANLCKPPLDTSEVMTIVESVCGRYPAGVKKAPEVLQAKPGISVSEASGVTELAMAKAISEAYGGRFHHVAESGKWVVCESDGVWRNDVKMQVEKWFFDLLKQGQELAIAMIRTGDGQGYKLLSAIQRAEKNGFIVGAKALLRALDNVTARQANFDVDPLMVAFRKGICANLRTGEIRQIQESDNFTKTLSVDYQEAAQCPLWRKSLLEWCCQDVGLAKFLQVLVGYCLTGLVEVQGFFMLIGEGRNGKSVFLNIVSALLGDYAIGINPESLMLRAGDSGPSNDIARLQGARLVTSLELPEGKVFNENLLKQLTGGDRVTARFLYSESFDFYPVLKLLIAANHKPIVKGSDFGFWRRVNMIPFFAQIEDPDPKLTEKLREELPGILNWALEGFATYRREGLIIPEAVNAESLAYREEMDITARWMTECVKKKLGNKVKASACYGSFKEWAMQNGFHVPNSSAFGRKIAGRITSKREASGTFYLDIDIPYVS